MTSETKLEFSPGAQNVINYAGETARLRGHKAVDSSHILYAALLNNTVVRFLKDLGVASSTHAVKLAWGHLVRNGFESQEGDRVTSSYAQVLNDARSAADKSELMMVNSVHLFSSALNTNAALADELLKGAKIDHNSLQEAANVFQLKIRLGQTQTALKNYFASPDRDLAEKLNFAKAIESQIPSRRRSL